MRLWDLAGLVLVVGLLIGAVVVPNGWAVDLLAGAAGACTAVVGWDIVKTANRST